MRDTNMESLYECTKKPSRDRKEALPVLVGLCHLSIASFRSRLGMRTREIPHLCRPASCNPAAGRHSKWPTDFGQDELGQSTTYFNSIIDIAPRIGVQ